MKKKEEIKQQMEVEQILQQLSYLIEESKKPEMELLATKMMEELFLNCSVDDCSRICSIFDEKAKE